MCGVRTSPLYATNQQRSIQIQAAETVSRGWLWGVAKTKVYATPPEIPHKPPFRFQKCLITCPGIYVAYTFLPDMIRDMRIGYARVSTDDQTLDMQRDALKRAKCSNVYGEQVSGKNADRPQLESCLKSLRKGDTLVVWRLDRLGRNLTDLVRLITELEQRSIHFESLTEKIETSSPAGRLVFHVFAALAEFESNLIRERTVAGLTAARARGRKGGRPVKLSPKEVKTIRALLKTADIPVAEIAARFGIARSTLYRTMLRPTT